MKEEDNAANQTPDGGDQDTANQTAQGSAEQAGTESPGAGDSEGLKAAVVAEQHRRQEAEERARLAEENLKLVQQQIAFSQQQQAPQEPADDEYVQFRDMRSVIDSKVNQVVQAMQQQAFQSQHPDYPEVVGSGQGRDFRPSETLSKVIKANSTLVGLDQMVASGNPAALNIAYSLAKQHRELEELRKAQSASRERSQMNKTDALTAPMSPAAAGGGGAVDMQVPDEYSDEFDTFYEGILNG